jgi:cyanate permease
MSSSTTAGPYEGWPTVEQAKAWEKAVPGSAENLFRELRTTMRHKRNMARLAVAVKVLPTLAALIATLALVWLAKYFVDHNAATQGATIVGSSLAAVVTGFIGNKIVQRKAKK